LDHVGFRSGHDLDVAPQIALLDHNHLTVVGFAALAFAFDVTGVFVSLATTGLARFDLRISTGKSSDRQQAADGNRSSE
jgi:hypothetical protein